MANLTGGCFQRRRPPRHAVDPSGSGTFYGYGASLVNAIDENGAIQGLNLSGTNNSLVVHNYSGGMPIHVTGGMTVAAGGTLQVVFDGATWGSTISFDPGIPVSLGGVLDLEIAAGANLASILGHPIQVFDWTGVSPAGQFAQIAASPLPVRFSWDTSALYTSGSIELTLGAGGPINAQWATNGSGNWSGTANWTGGAIPGAAQDTAVFGGALTWGTGAVNLDIPVSLAGLGFNAVNGVSYVVSTSSGMAITFASTAGAATIDNGGSNTVAVPIGLQNGLSANVAPGGALTILGNSQASIEQNSSGSQTTSVSTGAIRRPTTRI